MPTDDPAASRRGEKPAPSGFVVRFPRPQVAKMVFASFAVPVVSTHTALAAPILGAIKISGIRDELFWSVVCGTAGIAAFLLLRTILNLSNKVAGRNSKDERTGELPATSAEQFVEDAHKLHIDERIARETYQLLISLIPAEANIGIHDQLRESLQLTEKQISSLILSLPELCERSRQPANVASVHSVYDLLHHVESAPKSKSGQFYIRNGVVVPVPMATSSSPLADLQHASPRDSRFRTRAHFSGVKRRASDYSGPYRRSTDRKPNENYSGPFRRASDRKSTGGGSPDQRAGDRRSSERRAITPSESTETARQHRAVSADTSLLSQCSSSIPAQPTGKTDRDKAAVSVKAEGIFPPAIPLQQH